MIVFDLQFLDYFTFIMHSYLFGAPHLFLDFTIDLLVFLLFLVLDQSSLVNQLQNVVSHSLFIFRSYSHTHVFLAHL